MNVEPYVAAIRQASRPLEPEPTGTTVRLVPLAGVRAVLFDVYGTLLISASGDVGSADPSVRGAAFVEALDAAGLGYLGDPVSGAEELRRQIEAHHAAIRGSGVDFPEVEIRDVWREVVDELRRRDAFETMPATIDFGRLAIEFEVRANPVWPMPGMVECLSELRQRGTVLGIISNAQFFTPLAILATVGRSVEKLGFDRALQYYSYEHSRAKPGRWLYDQAASVLTSRGIAPAETLYVGNDMRNDIWPAASAGFRTALFAGDRRSLRLRQGDPARPNVGSRPDAIVDHLQQIPELLKVNEAST